RVRRRGGGPLAVEERGQNAGECDQAPHAEQEGQRVRQHRLGHRRPSTAGSCAGAPSRRSAKMRAVNRCASLTRSTSTATLSSDCSIRSKRESNLDRSGDPFTFARARAANAAAIMQIVTPKVMTEMQTTVMI